MRILIDGYNLLHATDLFGEGASAGTLQGSREALLAFLAAALSAEKKRATTIVFDAAGAPPGLPRSVHYDHIKVRYAREYADADTLLEEIIEDHRAPRELLVVSADHRVQRAARRRGAKYIDSQVWYADLVRTRKADAAERRESSRSPGAEDENVAYWVKQFDSPDLDTTEVDAPPRTPGETPLAVDGEKTSSKQVVDDADLANPFPPGYAEDLLDDEPAE